MSKTHEGYGTYYGNLVTLEQAQEISDRFSFADVTDTEDFVNTLKFLGVKEILFDLEDDCDYSDTIFFKTDAETHFKELMVFICSHRPDEFSQETADHFRMWFD